MLSNALHQLRGFGMILGALVLALALTACSNPPPTDDPGNGGDPGGVIPGNGNDNANGPTQPEDQDGDGVIDDDDECPGTAPGAMVDETGCPLTQPGGSDEDGDGVPDPDDLCPETPDGEQVDDDGCAESQLDNDSDGVPDPDDLCPDTPEGEQVDGDGCAESQLNNDSDGDGVPDVDDLCPETAPGERVDETGCVIGGHTPPNGGGDGGGDTPVCGDGIIDPGEDCDPPNSFTCDANCLYIIVGSFSADDCEDAVASDAEGLYSLDNSMATLDGPPHTACVAFGEDQINYDVWVCWTSPCSATAFIQTCDLTTVDTKFAVYEGCDCPVTDARLLACNDDACASQSLASFEAVAGQSYLIRMGTYPPRPPGFGLVKVTCGIHNCPGSGDCFSGNWTPGCDDETCCETTCTVDPYCCDTEWDEVCADEAVGLCGDGFPACSPDAGSCTAVNGTPGCEDVDCCNDVCRVDTFCCLDTWDSACVEQEAMICFSTCIPGAGGCFVPNGSPGCDDEACCAEVCPRDPFCCQVGWDPECVSLANDLCP